MTECGGTGAGKRQCGTCRACCRVLAVSALGKPAGRHCEHETEAGCGIYHDRPEACRTWYCMWVRDNRGIFDEHHRPDRLGLMLDSRGNDAASGRPSIVATEVIPDAAAEPEARRVIQFLRQFAIVSVRPYRPAQPANVALTVAGEPRASA